jgi:hypothetical protein
MDFCISSQPPVAESGLIDQGTLPTFHRSRENDLRFFLTKTAAPRGRGCFCYLFLVKSYLFCLADHFSQVTSKGDPTKIDE